MARCIDAGADSQTLVQSLEALGTGAKFEVEKTKRRGIAASKFRVIGGDGKTHRHLKHILEIIANSGISERAKQNASAVFQRLGEAEAKVHDVSIEKVHFHEVGAVDSICDIVGASIGFDLLDIGAVYSSPVNVGSGTVKTEHGILPVPAPATSELLTGKPIYARGPSLELTTPTGAAIAATLAVEFGALPPMRVIASGYGAGDYDFPEHANVLRVLIGETSGASKNPQRSRCSKPILTIPARRFSATPWSDCSKPGALDVTLASVQMKKSRPGTLLSVIARPEDREALARLIFEETSTLGLRISSAERRVKARHSVEIATPHGTVRMKIAENGSFAPEYEDCRKLARESGVPLKQILAEANLRLSEELSMKYYLTTPIYYVNAAPHLGTAYSTFAADLIKRFKKMEGYDPGGPDHGLRRAQPQSGARRAGRGRQPAGVHHQDGGRVHQPMGQARNRLRPFHSHLRPEASRDGALAVRALPKERLHLQRFVHGRVLR